MNRSPLNLSFFLALLLSPLLAAWDVITWSALGPVLVGAVGLFLVVTAHPWERGGTVATGVFGACLALASLIWGGWLFSSPIVSILLVPESWVEDRFLPARWYVLVLVYVAAAVTWSHVREADPGFVPQESADRWNPAHAPAFPLGHAFSCLLVGSLAILFGGVNLIQRLLVLAPIFEELFKFGGALLFASVLIIRGLHGRIALGVLVGFLFGVLEHVTTYPDEGDAYFLSRAIFHSISTALSMACYTALERIGSGVGGSRWLAPLPSIIFHAANNGLAVAYAVVDVLVLPGTTWIAPPIGFLFSALMLAMILTVNMRPRVMSPLERLWGVID